MPASTVATFTDASFDTEVLRSSIPVLVDFWAEGCGGCRQIAPTIDRVANQFVGQVRVGKLEVLTNMDTAMRYRIRILPTLLLFRGGQVVSESVGVLNETDLQT